jgi:hypothetical protein
MRKIRLKWDEFTLAWDVAGHDGRAYVDLDNAAVVVIVSEAADRLDRLDGQDIEGAIEDMDLRDWEAEELRAAAAISARLDNGVVAISSDILQSTHGDLRDFAATVADAKTRRALEAAMNGRGAFRRFRDEVEQHFRERKRWYDFAEERQRQRATKWLASLGVEVDWILPPPPPPAPDPREKLLAAVLKFTRTAAALPGVKRIAMVGSLTRNEPDPKDADVLVTVSDDMDLAPLAAAGRKMAGAAQQIGRGGDTFLANESGSYIGRTCHWRNCGGGRAGCDARHCGRREYLHDDLDSVELEKSLVAAPPIELWPTIQTRVPVPPDVERIVLEPLRAS